MDKIAEEKMCVECEIEKPYSLFTVSDTQNDGYCAKCKDCRAADSRKDYSKNREKILMRKRATYYKNREKECERMREYRARTKKPNNK